jgi:hypothetical protein
MNRRQIEVSTDTFAALWSDRRSDEFTEEDVIKRLLSTKSRATKIEETGGTVSTEVQLGQGVSKMDRPPSIKWTELLVWSLKRLGGQGTLSEIYRVSREGRRSLGHATTLHHDDSARECLESHCSDSKKYRWKADLFWMPMGKGAGVWALR